MTCFRMHGRGVHPSLARGGCRVAQPGCKARQARPKTLNAMGDASALVKERVVEQFDRRAPSYDNDNSYHPPLAAKVIQVAQLGPGEAVLDLATGTGLVALAAAAAVGPQGRVVGVDISPGMLQQARSKPAPAGGAPVEWMQADIEQLQLPPHSFDVLTCSAALPFLTRIPATLAAWHTLLKQPGGRLVFNSFKAPAVVDFGVLRAVAVDWGVEVVDPCAVVGSREQLEAILATAGFKFVEVQEEAKQRVYAANSPATYAEGIYQQSVFNNPFSPITAEALGGQQRLEAFKAAVVDAVAARVAAQGRWRQGEGVLSPYTVLHVCGYA